MLPRPARVAKPRIIRDVDQPGWAIIWIHHLTGKDRFVADQYTQRRQARNVQRPRPGPRAEAAAGHQLYPQGQPRRLILAKRNQMPFVIDGGGNTTRKQCEQRVARPAIRPEPHRPNQRGLALGCISNRFPRGGVGFEHERRRGFRPYDHGGTVACLTQSRRRQRQVPLEDADRPLPAPFLTLRDIALRQDDGEVGGLGQGGAQAIGAQPGP